MKSKHLILFSFIFSLLLIGLLFYYDVLTFYLGAVLTLFSTTLHSILYSRFHLLNREFERLNETLEDLISGVHETRIYPMNEKNRVLNANVNRLAKQLEKMSVKKLEDEQMIRLLTNNITSPIIYIDIDGRTRYINGSFNLKFKTNIHTNDMYELIHVRKIFQFIDESFIRELNDVQTISIDDQYFQANAICIVDNDDRFIGILFIFHDITDIKKFEKLQREFLADASHELKTPISAIKGAAEILLDRPHEPETVLEFLHMIQNENVRMEKIVQDILLISKLENDINLILKPINLNKVIEDVIHQLELRMSQKNQQIELNLEDQLRIQGDPERLKHALSNLIVNASNYTNEGKTIFIKGWVEADQVIVQVKDQGIGIGPKDIPHIFERFYRVDKARSRETGGTGLGLSIVKSVVDVHNATITVSSELNKGTSFTIAFKKYSE